MPNGYLVATLGIVNKEELFLMMIWIIFTVFVLMMLTLDLMLAGKNDRAVTFKEAAIWSVIWVLCAFCFNGVIYYFQGREAAFQFLAAYLIEKSLSVDNLFVFLLIFKYFNVDPRYLRRVLFLGIFGALVLRAIFIIAGLALVSRFHWVIYLFGGFLILTGIKMAFQKDKALEPEKNPVIKFFKYFFPVSDAYDGGKFFIKQGSRLVATPLFIVLLLVETTDVIFAVDSIPAVFSITLDPFIAYTSNVFAILGLRSLFFLLAGMMDKFHFLSAGLSVILVLIGTKMLISDLYHIPISVTLSALVVILTLSIVMSILRPKKLNEA
ncbi:MAG: TerC family protein [Nitrospirota bacterium]